MLEKRSFLMKVVGLYRIRYGYASSIWILVFQNSLNCQYPIDATLDLKGRIPKPGKSLKERGRISKYSSPIKDNELARGLYIKDPHERKFFITQIKKDTNFLKRFNLMDYSLLVGVHRPKKEFKSCSFNSCSDGFLGEDPNGELEIYHFGIIDCLTHYNIKKKLARAFKSILWGKETLSTVDSDYYTERFQKFMTYDLLARGELRHNIIKPN